MNYPYVVDLLESSSYAHWADPRDTILEPGLDGGAWFLPIFGGVFLVVGVAVFFLLMRVGQFMAEPL